ncbi:MAG: hypothetical protein JSS90_11565 [Bacteroidetes bacterium]|jgi:hypothetical protein|nr:hypothetical protein [Bacteroidota bacterium]
MKKTRIIFAFIATVLFNNVLNAESSVALKTHCVFMTYNYTLLGTQHQGSGFYCIEWFWRTGQQPEVGEQTKATIDSKESQFDSSDEIEFIKDQIIETTYEKVKVKFKLPKGKYRVNDNGKIDCIAIVVE